MNALYRGLIVAAVLAAVGFTSLPPNDGRRRDDRRRAGDIDEAVLRLADRTGPDRCNGADYRVLHRY